MYAHNHDYQPHPDIPTVKVCAVEECDAHENDGQETWLGQLLVNEQWVDYARGPAHAAISWAEDGEPGTRRVVYWTRKSVPVWPVPSILDTLPED